MVGNIKKRLKEHIYFFKANVRSTDYKKNALLSYIATPFFKKYEKLLWHPNAQEVLVLSEVLSENGYNIDVIEFTNCRKVDYNKYDLVVGFGNPFEQSFNTNKALKRIFLATGAHPYFQNKAELERIERIYKAYNVLLKPRRQLITNWPLSYRFSDAIILTGNEWTKETFKGFTEVPIYLIHNTIFETFPLNKLYRDYATSRNNFLWLGSHGLVHKGLDLAIEFFEKHKGLNLHICGPNEQDFFKLYNLDRDENIIYHGFVDTKTDKFKKIVEACSFLFFPTCSEGQSGSTLQTMYSGLIPVVTKECGVTVDNIGYYLEDKNSWEALFETKITKLTEGEILERSKESFRYVFENHRITNYKNNLVDLIKKIGIA